MEKYLYLLIDLFSFAIPFAYSFEKKRMHFIKDWKAYFSSILIIGILFLVWDVYFAYQNVWGFNPKYLIGYNFLKLPLEEYLFFLLIPFSSNFIHYALLYFYPKPKLSAKFANVLSWSLFAISLVVAVINSDKMYTLICLGTFSLLMLIQSIKQFPYFRRYALSFGVIFMVFFLVNSFLTGSFTKEPIVWYNNTENLNIRLGTIPIEDIFYCFTLLYSSLILFEFLKTKKIIS